MWWLTTASDPKATATVALSSAPTARIGRAVPRTSGTGWGAMPRERRRTWVRPSPRARTTESSHRMWIARS